MPNKKIAITLGEPAGIGVELVCKLATKNLLQNCIVIGDENLLLEHINNKQLSLTVNQNQNKAPDILSHHISVLEPVELGVLNKNNAAYVLSLLDEATKGCLSGKYAAMVTCPLHKGVINDAQLGAKFTGHTEYLAGLSQTKKVVMMLLNQYMKVALATTHIPLKDVSSAITKKELKQVIAILQQDLKSKFSIKNPKIAVCGLNPHAGEDGHLGREEIDTIIPTLKELNAQSYNLIGPIPADTLFTQDKVKNYDAILAMYHDQGLAPLKYAGFGKSVNLTLGLPFIRTSVDHGTALDIAGQDKASESSLLEAINTARELLSLKSNG